MNVGFTTAQLHFETLEEIGQEGKNSKVYSSHDKQLDANIAIKKIEKKKLADEGIIQFFDEAKRLYDSNHPNVVQIKYACYDDENIYLAMPLYKNGSLKRLIDERFLTVKEILRYSIQFLSGLNNIHVKKLIHFDVKPDNILLSDSNEALLSDFGLSKNMNDFGMSELDVAYTRQVPPERYTQTQQSNLFDIYMAGVTIYRLCNGNQGFNEHFETLKHDRNAFIDAIRLGNFPNRKSYLPHIPISLRKVVNKAMDINQTKRYQTAIELINALGKIDKLLDWQFEILLNQRQWKLELEDKIILVTQEIYDGFSNILASKTMKDSGRTQKITNGCRNLIQIDEVDTVLQHILLELET